jgi:hypothetical protein
MVVQNLESLQYPIGRFTKGRTYTENQIKLNCETFAAFPNKLKDLVSNWDDKILSVQYRDGGWNGRQVVHHLADSHANCFIRFKTALIDDAAKIKPYAEDKWAELQDSKMSIAPSLLIIEGVHARLTELFKSLNDADWAKTIYHPESKHVFTVAELQALYTWHGNHHYAHLKLIEQNSRNK